MTRKIGRTRNFNDTAIVSPAISLNSTTSTKIADSDENRIFFAIVNDTSRDVWLKLQAAAVDNILKGILLHKNSYWEMSPDNIYTGEISAISVTGTPDVFVTEY